jgi:ribosomal protein S12 methylthiotransferase
MAEVVSEARALIGAGAGELNLIAQDTTAYGRESREPGGLAALLRTLDALDGRFWLRVMYGYPSLISDALLETIATSQHVCRYFDVPLQHSHPDILRAMRRADTIKPVATLAARIRHAVPGAVLRTTCLVGFPGENDAHFEHLLATVTQARFDHVGVFVYSPEEGTASYRMDAVPPPEVAAERRQRLMLAQRRIVDEKRRELVGTHADALLIRPSRPLRGRPTWEARLERQAPDVDGVTRVVGAPAHAKPGDWARVTLTGGRSYDLYATVEKRLLV